MNPYDATLFALVAALAGQALAAGIAFERGLGRPRHRAWLALAVGSLLLALHHGYTLELALRAGLYDLRQAILAALAGALYGGAVLLLRREFNPD
ncbi:MAG: hypothetical protein KA603_14885 [Azonexus sp.]|nr:hypothetical protein [Betaproteobacteria bacterium]MBK8919454.1 hypothetical protein [Betaproteobacteria bacterium]MBP6037410.1 hypothetical protein [Azonexus sp.]MBP6907911.1 hypothetical protein [Azonexus sp.]